MAASRRESPVSLANIERLFEEVHGSIEQQIMNTPPELQARLDAAEQRRADARAAAKARRKSP
jgi:hypothetical protein